MKLKVVTPFAIVVDAVDIAYIRAEDESGAFGVLAGHSDFLTVLAVSVVTWRDASGLEHYLAVRGGVLQVMGGDTAEIASPEAVLGDDLHRLETEVLARFRRRLSEERAARSDAQRLHVAAMRQIVRFIRAQRPSVLQGGPASVSIESLGS